MICFRSERLYSSGATAADGLVALDAIAVPMLTAAMPGEAAEGSCRAYCFGGGVFSLETFATGEVVVFRGTGSSIPDGLCRGVATLPLAVAVDVFASAFTFFEVADDFLVLLIGRSSCYLIR